MEGARASLTSHQKNLIGCTTLADYHYLADGMRVSAHRTDGTGIQYRGSLIYTKDTDGGLELDCALTSGSDNSNANSLERTGLMDFTGSGDYNIETDDVLYITTTNKDGKVAHNGYNYGNFLWGAGATRLGVPGKIAKIGADVNNFLHDVESRFHPDSKDDQKSISMGINWAKEHKNK